VDTGAREATGEASARAVAP